MSNAVYKASEEVVSCDLNGEAALLDLRSSRYFGLNAVGSLIWQRLEKPASLQDLVETVSTRFSVAPERAEADVKALLAQLQAQNLILVTEAADLQGG